MKKIQFVTLESVIIKKLNILWMNLEQMKILMIMLPDKMI